MSNSPVVVVNPHTEVEVDAFATEMNITIEKAHYIEKMREHYILWEYDYLKKPSLVQDLT